MCMYVCVPRVKVNVRFDFIKMAKRSQFIKISMRTLIFLLLFASVAAEFGFDSANACSPNGKLTRRGRAQMLATIPCDLGKQAFCHLPGTAYPWHAVRRFVHENQGLMKRMYGDVRHISILRDEIQNNEIEIDDMEIAADRYTKDSKQRAGKYMLHNRDDYMNYKAANNDVLMAPHFRPVASTTTTTTTTSTPIETPTTKSATPSTTTSMPTTGDSPANIETTTSTNGNKADFDGDGDRDITQPTLAANEIPTLISFESIEDDDSDEAVGVGVGGTIDISNVESNSVYAQPPAAPPSTLAAQMGDNIEIIESPQLGLHNLSDAEQPVTISTTLKVATTAKAEATRATPSRRVAIRRRPAVQQQQQQQQQQPTRKVNLTILKESSNSKSTQSQTPTTTTTTTTTATKTNESERTPSTSASSSSPTSTSTSNSAEPTNAVKGVAVFDRDHDDDDVDVDDDADDDDDVNVSTTHNTATGTNTKTTTTNMISSSASAWSPSAATLTTTLKTSSSTATLFRGYAHRNATNNNNNNNNYYNYNYSHNNRRHQYINAHTPSTTTTTTTTKATANNAASSSPTSASNASVLPLKLRKPATSVTPELNNATATTSTSTPAVAAAAATASSSSSKPVLRDGQLYQDTMKQEQPTMFNSRGVNACPVKEEVVAPFWANNTRGEVLALLNLYPFEQYVHWEKCTHEHKQMYCRDGCRCEQQYRLHRLLAYDPHNECRGIFSDWFRFPSSCICKCYDIPMDFRATSRSPRSDTSNFDDDGGMSYLHPIEVAEAQVKRAIYEHATEQWYRPRDEFDME